MSEAISIKTLGKNSAIIFNFYKLKFGFSYNSALFENFNRDTPKPNDTSELIIENGFRIYGIIKAY